MTSSASVREISEYKYIPEKVIQNAAVLLTIFYSLEMMFVQIPTDCMQAEQRTK